MKRYKNKKQKKVTARRRRTDKPINKIVVKNKLDNFREQKGKKSEASDINIILNNSIGVDSENLQPTSIKLSNDNKTAYDTILKSSTRTP